MLMNEKEIVSNRRAFYDYEVLEKFETGLVLQGTEVKSLREGGGSLQESYVKILGDEVFLVGCTIAPYRHGNIHNHEERQDRKLLLHRREINKLKAFVKEKGMTLIALRLYFVKGLIKLTLGCCRGKKQYDKRASIKERDDKRSMARELKKQ
jgi:SsrA-binding protein